MQQGTQQLLLPGNFNRLIPQSSHLEAFVNRSRQADNTGTYLFYYIEVGMIPNKLEATRFIFRAIVHKYSAYDFVVCITEIQSGQFLSGPYKGSPIVGEKFTKSHNSDSKPCPSAVML